MRKMIFRRMYIGIFAVAAMGMLAFTGISHASGCNVTLNQIKEQIPIRKNMKIIRQEPAESGVCEIIVGVITPYGRSLLPIYYLKGSKGAIIGAFFKNGINRTNSVLTKIRRADVKKAFAEVKKDLPSVVMARYKPKNASGKYLYAFVDPLCPFCHMAEKHLKELADKSGYTINLVPFIVHGKPAKDKTESFICEHRTFNDWLNNNFGKGGDKCRRADEMIKKAASVVVKLHFGGTPTFITDDGQTVEGANMLKLKKILGIGGKL